MSLYDNEIYRGPPEAAPTLTEDTSAYGMEFYIVKPPKTTAQQDVPPTEEAAQQESKPAEKKKSKIAKALKLLTSCTAAVLVATTLTVPLRPARPVSELPLWSRFGPVHGNGQFSFSASAVNSDICQVSIGSKSYCLTAQQEGLYLQWHETYDASQDGSSGGFYLCMENLAESWTMILDFNVNPLHKVDSDEGLGQIQTISGDSLYVRCFYLGGDKTLLSAQEIVNDLGSYIQFSEATNDGWGNVFIGDTMYSETNEHWNGFQAIYPGEENKSFNFQRICHTADAGYSLANLVCSHWVNNIDWCFYFSIEKGESMLWAVPNQEDIALGRSINDLLYDYGIDPAMLEEIYGSEVLADIQSELTVKLREELQNTVEVYIIGCGLQYYHLVE